MVRGALTPGTLPRLEGGAGFALALLFYQRQHGTRLLFILLILAPDQSMIGYLGRRRIGAACYNAVHRYQLPVELLGYGLKYSRDCKDTHLQRL